jgi:hypothetical protein
MATSALTAAEKPKYHHWQDVRNTSHSWLVFEVGNSFSLSVCVCVWCLLGHKTIAHVALGN